VALDRVPYLGFLGGLEPRLLCPSPEPGPSLHRLVAGPVDLYLTCSCSFLPKPGPSPNRWVAGLVDLYLAPLHRSSARQMAAGLVNRILLLLAL
jgi:hypothetical protein